MKRTLHILELFRQGSFHFNETLTNSIRSVELFIKDLDTAFFKPWTLETTAEHCGLGVTRFVHYFRQLTNSTPMQNLNHLRVEAATVKLIHDPARNISENGYDCGFSSSQYFATVFRKQFGCTPASYRLTATNNSLLRNKTSPESV